jgi:hypothetical protein
MVLAVIHRHRELKPAKPTSDASRRARRGRLGVAVLSGLVCAIALALAGRLAAQAALQRGEGSARDAGTDPGPALLAAPSIDSGSFGIRGEVTGLFPGDSQPLVLTVSNPQHFAIVVTSIVTTVSSPGGGCSRSYMTVSGFSGALTVAARGLAQARVTATMSLAAPDACEGAIFPFSYSGTAHRA